MDSVLFLNGYVWQSQQQSVPALSWLLISRPEDPKYGNGKVLALGVGEAPAGRRREASEVIDLAGAVVLPGLQDAHIHIGAMGERKTNIQLANTPGYLIRVVPSHTDQYRGKLMLRHIAVRNSPLILSNACLRAPPTVDLIHNSVSWLHALINTTSVTGHTPAHYVDLSSCRSILDLQKTVREHAERKPQLPWVIGTGWDQNLWSPPVSPTRFDLDVVLPSDRPCMLYRRCWHMVAANTVAMRAAGVDPDKVWPPPSSGGDGLDSGGGATSQDDGEMTARGNAEIDGVDVDDSHHPTGLFREDSMKLVESAVTAPSFETRCEQHAEALDRCLRSGLTAVQTNDGNAIRVYKRLQEDGRLPIRVFLTLSHDELEQAPTACKTTARDEVINAAFIPSAAGGVCVKDEGDQESSRKPWSGGEGLLSWHRVKLFEDGSLGAETAAMRIPYVGTTNTGLLIHDQETLTRKVTQAKDYGFRLEIHAIGDRALVAVLDAFEGAGVTAIDRPIVTHCQVVGPDLVSRMEKLGAVAAVQPSFVPSDAPVVMKRLSPVVHASCYPWRTLMNNGVTCAGGSDAPIESQDPLRGIYDAVFRPNKRPSVEPSGSGPHEFGVDPFLPDERLTLEEAVWMYSAGGAFAAGMEDRLGTIKEGFMADLTVLKVEGGAEALLENPSLIIEAKISQVWVGGTRRWLAPADDSERSEGDRDGTDLSQGLLSGSGLPGKNGPKRKRGKSDNPWLSRGPGRIGRCRCCS